MQRVWTTIVALVVFVLLPVPGAFQVVSDNGANLQARTASFTFVDPSCDGKPVNGVRVRIERPHKRKQDKWELVVKGRTDAAGHFTSRVLPAGQYRMLSEKYGFKRMLVSFDIVEGNGHNQTLTMERGYASSDMREHYSTDYDPCKHEDLKPMTLMD
ncbi:MAG: carboxypeptidase regulatory-like domain-containing protein [Acidobacteria bacterium]|nr:carboxypeptidase regulatory-like domain-containing protein [Acidobacteriota bacterium]